MSELGGKTLTLISATTCWRHSTLNFIASSHAPVKSAKVVKKMLEIRGKQRKENKFTSGFLNRFHNFQLNRSYKMENFKKMIEDVM